MSIFKYILFRIAGESFSQFDDNAVEYNTLKQQITDYNSLVKQKQILKIEICDILFILINIFEDFEEKKALINFKRDVFNDRNIVASKILDARKKFTPELEKAFNDYESVKKNIELLYQEISISNQTAYEKDLQVIKNICRKETFRNGLVLSSEVLLKYARDIDKKKSLDEPTLLGLWKYITRAIAKATPFSTFTQLNIGALSNNLNQTVLFDETNHSIHSKVRYNNYILETLLLLIKNHPLIFPHLNIRSNLTIQQNSESLTFFTNNNNNESIQTLSKNDLIDFILTTIDENHEITVAQLREQILLSMENGSTEAVDKYLFELIQTGLLDTNVNLSGLDSEWDKSLKGFISNYLKDEEIGVQMVGILQKLEERRFDYSTHQSQQREFAINEITELMNSLLSVLQGDMQADQRVYKFVKADNPQGIFLHKLPTKAEGFKQKNIIYEDTTRSINIMLDQKKVERFVNKLNTLMVAFSCLPFYNPDKVTNYNFFIGYFSETKEVSLLEFYEKLNKVKSNSPNDFSKYQNVDSAFLSKANIVTEKLSRFIALERNIGNIMYNSDEVLVADAFIDKMLIEFKQFITGLHGASYSSFVQFYNRTDVDGRKELCGVINGILPGKGKMVSRFLYLFDDHVVDGLKDWNIQNMNDDEIFAENNDASFFNANLHPRLMPYEIELPGGNVRDSTNLINISDLKVRANSITKELELYYKDEKKVSVYDLCFQNPMHRSTLYRLLSLFGQNYGYPVLNITNAFNSHFTRQVETGIGNLFVSVIPRICVAETIVLQRKKWQIPLNTFTNIPQNKIDFSLSIQRLRMDIGIPDEVFVRLHHAPSANPNNQPVVIRDDYKPQYINFNSPISLRLLAKIIGKTADGTLSVEEMLPSSDKLFTINNLKFSTESLIHWQ